MYKPALVEFAKKRNASLLEQKDIVLLAKQDEKYYRVKEYIGLIVKIYPKTYGTDIPMVRIRFQDNKEFDVRVYLDNNITENCFVSIYGIIIPSKTGQLEFICKGGMVRTFDTLMQAGKINTKYLYRFGIVELSEVKESIRYSSNLQGIEVLEKDRLWTYSGNDINQLENTKKEVIEEEDFIVDFSTTDEVYINSKDGSISSY